LTPDLSRTCSEEGCGRVPSRFVADARKHEAPIKQIAKDFGISEVTQLIEVADVEEGVRVPA